MSNSRSAIVFGPGYAAFNSGNYRFTDGGIIAKFMIDSKPVTTDEFGEVDASEVNKYVEVEANLWAGWENVAAIFASSFLNPTRGAGLFGGSDLPLVINGRNGDRLTLHNFRWTEIPQLDLKVDGQLFASAIKGVGLIRDSYEPEDANAYFTWATGQSYSPPAFSLANFKAPRMSATWGSVDGFAAFEGKQGFQLRPTVKYLPDEMGRTDGRGLIEKYIDTIDIEASCEPLGPTVAQIQTAMGFGRALGSRRSTVGDDLTITGGSMSFALKSMVLQGANANFNTRQTRPGELTWKNTVPFTSGAPIARAVIS